MKNARVSEMLVARNMSEDAKQKIVQNLIDKWTIYPDDPEISPLLKLILELKLPIKTKEK